MARFRSVTGFVGALALVLLLPARYAGAEATLASIAPCRDLPHTALSQLPEGIAGCARLSVDTGFMAPAGQWTWRHFQAPVLAQGAIAIGGRVEIGLALPVVFHVDPQPADATHAFIANRVTAGPLHLDAKLVLIRRPEGARGFGFAARIWNDFSLPGADERFSTGLAAVADWRFSHGIVVAAQAGFTFGLGYRLDRFAAESIVYGLGFHIALGPRIALLAELDGRAALPGTTGSKLDAWLGVRIRDERVFFTLAAGAPLLDRDAVLVHFALHWDGGVARAPAAVPEDVDLPEDGCVLHRCTPVQRAAVLRALAVQIETIRSRLLRLGDLIELHIRERAGASESRAIVCLSIPNDLSIANDAERKREVSIRFLLAVFARGGIPIERDIAAALIDRIGWRVQVERDIDEPLVDYFTYDLPRLSAEYAAFLRERAGQLREAKDALRAAWAQTDEIFFDIARGHANGLIGVANGLLDLPLAPINLVRFATGREAIHGLGRIPHLEYKSEWGRKFGGAMELGVALGTMTAPGASLFAGLGRTVAPAVGRLSELSNITWNGLPVGRFVQTLLVKWTQGSVVAVKVHAAVDAGEIVRALVTRQIRNPDGTYRPMNADDFEQLVFSFIQDAAVVKLSVEGKRAIEEEPLPERNRRGADKGKRPPKPRLPKDGTWSGEEGNSLFKPNHPEKLGLRPDEVIRFVDGRPDFSPWAVEEFEVPEMNGWQDHDKPFINRTIAQRKGLLKRDGTPNADAGENWIKERGLATHHARGYIVHLIPWKLHWWVRHTGGAYDLRQRGR